MGAIVYLTRNDDYDLSNPRSALRKRSDLSNRAIAINNSNADLYLSIHLNASTSTSWRGAQAFYDDINPKNKQIAEEFQKYFNKYLYSKRKAKEINDLYMYKRINVPGLLLEVGFISNPNERYVLQQNWYQEKIVNTICKCVTNILL
jgi:N-acetylmuramoyl-L-alanine amidase